MEVTFRLEKFEGPLDLLLHLIVSNKVSVDDIPIASILEQYLEYLEGMRSLNIEVTSDFIVMAARLIYIKSKMLLPKEESKEEDPRLDLARALAEYKAIKEAAALLKNREEMGRDLISKPFGPVPGMGEYACAHDPCELIAALAPMLEREKEAALPPKAAFKEILSSAPVSIEEQARRILDALSKFGRRRMLDFFEGVRDRATAVAVFLALLGLCQERRIIFDCEGNICIEEEHS